MAFISAKFVNFQTLEKALLNAFEEWAENYVNDIHWEKQFDDMTRWNWDSKTGRTDGKTQRKNGELVDSPRDIYDLGKLYKSGVDSFKFNRTSNGAEATWHWDATNSSGQEYAWYVHAGTEKMKDRPFTDDISIAASFFRKGPGKALKSIINQYLATINAR